MKKVATIIVTYNGAPWLDKCLGSVQSSSYPSDVFVVDNASTDNTLSLLKKHQIFDIEVYESNLGFGAANNIALEKALKLDYDFFFLINQDLYLQENTLNLFRQANGYNLGTYKKVWNDKEDNETLVELAAQLNSTDPLYSKKLWTLLDESYKKYN